MSQFARDFAATGLSYAQIKGISDSELMELLAGGADSRRSLRCVGRLV